MSPQEGDIDRLQRVRRLRTAWRKGQQTSDPSSAPGVDTAEDQRSDTLESNDRIRAEAPDDLETRRRADQLEREIKRSDRKPRDRGSLR